MDIETPLELAEQWEATLAKIEPEEDHVAAIEICMMLGTRLLNAVFHKCGIREEAFDQNHTTRSRIPSEAEQRITPDVRALMGELHYVEQMRGLHCRGISGKLRDARDLPEWNPEVSVKCIAIIRKLRAFTDQVMKE